MEELERLSISVSDEKHVQTDAMNFDGKRKLQHY
jgi:hypothetical protein